MLASVLAYFAVTVIGEKMVGRGYGSLLGLAVLVQVGRVV